MSEETLISYRRKGRHLRATGRFIAKVAGGMVKVKPLRSDWGSIILTAEEIAAGNTKPPVVPRKKSEKPPSRQRRPKPAPVPRWQQLVNQVRQIQDDYSAMPFPPVSQKLLTELAEEIERCNSIPNLPLSCPAPK